MKIEFGKLYDAEMVHPREYESAKACQSVPVYDWLGRQAAQIKKNLTELPEAAARWFPVNRFTCPRLYELYRIARNRLDCQEEYPLFLKNGYDLTAKVFGSRSEGHFIVMNDACVETLDDGELLALIGQQLGHIRADHIQQMELLELLESSVQAIPVMGTILGKQLWSYFAEWVIAAQFTADRAAAFAARSVSAAERLLIRQIGLSPDTPEARALLRQPVERGDKKPGIFFIRNYQDMPCFGNVERIAELDAWACSSEMKKNHPQVYYQYRVEKKDKALSAEDESVLRLHEAVMGGDVKAALLLAERYTKGGKELPVSTAAAAGLFFYASCHGEPLAMRYLIGFMQHNIDGMDCDDRVIEQLYRAAYSRNLKTARQNPYAPLPVNKKVSALAHEMMQKYDRTTLCDNDARTIKDAFWIPADDTVFSCISYGGRDGQVYGIAVTSKGLYGRVGEKDMPYFICWSDFETGELYSRKTDDGWWLFSGNAPLVKKPGNMRGTAAELLILLKSRRGGG